MLRFDVHSINYFWSATSRAWLIELRDEHAACLKRYKSRYIDKIFRQLDVIQDTYPEAVVECL